MSGWLRRTELRRPELLRPARDGEAEVGERVTVLDLTTSEVRDYWLVDAATAREDAGELSTRIALGAALLGRHVGDVVTVETGGRPSRLEVVEIDG